MKIGFIGVGNMGGAILKGYYPVSSKNGDKLFAFDKNTEKLKELSEEFSVIQCSSIINLVEKSEVVILGVKPNIFEEVLLEIEKSFSKDKVLVSMAAGISIEYIEKYLGDDKEIIRIMPNTPAFVKEGMTAICRNKNINNQTFNRVIEIFQGIGYVCEISEDLIHTVIGVSGSSPAYTYMYIEALKNSAVKRGMKEEDAILFAAQSVLGAAKMVRETGIDPKILRDNVCSPGGTTIEAVNVLLENDFSKDIDDAFEAAYAKSKMMTK